MPNNWTYVDYSVGVAVCQDIHWPPTNSYSNIIKPGPYLAVVLDGGTEPKCLFLTLLRAEISVRCMGYNLLAGPARSESDVECKWNVKCGISKNIKECSKPPGTRKINDPDWLLHKNKDGREWASVWKRGQSSSYCVFYNWMNWSISLISNRQPLIPQCGVSCCTGQENTDGFDFTLAHQVGN